MSTPRIENKICMIFLTPITNFKRLVKPENANSKNSGSMVKYPITVQSNLNPMNRARVKSFHSKIWIR